MLILRKVNNDQTTSVYRVRLSLLAVAALVFAIKLFWPADKHAPAFIAPPLPPVVVV